MYGNDLTGLSLHLFNGPDEARGGINDLIRNCDGTCNDCGVQLLICAIGNLDGIQCQIIYSAGLCSLRNLEVHYINCVAFNSYTVLAVASGGSNRTCVRICSEHAEFEICLGIAGVVTLHDILDCQIGSGQRTAVYLQTYVITCCTGVICHVYMYRNDVTCVSNYLFHIPCVVVAAYRGLGLAALTLSCGFSSGSGLCCCCRSLTNGDGTANSCYIENLVCTVGNYEIAEFQCIHCAISCILGDVEIHDINSIAVNCHAVQAVTSGGSNRACIRVCCEHAEFEVSLGIAIVVTLHNILNRKIGSRKCTTINCDGCIITCCTGVICYIYMYRNNVTGVSCYAFNRPCQSTGLGLYRIICNNLQRRCRERTNDQGCTHAECGQC